MQNNINSVIEGILTLKKQGKTPQAVMQILLQRNPQYKIMLERLQNMSQGKNPQEFVMQLARQRGVSEQNLQAISQLFGK